MLKSIAFPISGLLALLTLAGCSGGPKRYPVTGTVTVDGVPLVEGDIVFVPEDKTQGAEPGKIKDGKFELK